MHARVRLTVLTVLACAIGAAAPAHQLAFTDVQLRLPGDGTYVVDVRCDLDALALGVPSTADSAALKSEIEAMEPAQLEDLLARLERLLQRRIRVRFDGARHEFSLSMPQRGEPPPPGMAPSALGLVARLSGSVPEEAQEVSFFASRAFPPVRLRVARAGEEPSPIQVLVAGEESPPVPLSGPIRLATGWETFRRFTVLGVTHILPAGLDHVLFVLGLALLSPRFGPLLAQVSAFTLAHTLTLALSSYGVVRLPPSIVEPLIALSIVYVGLENAVSPKLRRSRLVLVFGFGLLHGLGFAGVLGELGMPEGQRLTALLAFNLGVELGQLAVIGLAALALLAWSRLGRERGALVRPLSLLIAAIGLFWAIERLVAIR